MLSLSQQPHLQLDHHLASLDLQLSEAESAWLDDKAEVAKQLIENRPDLADRLAMLDAAEAIRQREELSDRQTAFLDELARRLEELEPWSARAIQDEIFESARGVGIDPKSDAALVFEAVYRVLFGSETGPRAGSYLEFLGRDETLQRLR